MYQEQEEDCNVKPELTMEIKTISGNNPKLNMPMNVSVSVDSPVFHYVDLKNVSDAINYMNIFIFSDTNSCGTVSIHPMKCPIPDGYDDNVENDILSSWIHMYTTGVLTLNTDAYKADSGFFIKFTTYSSNCLCDRSCGNQNSITLPNESKLFTYNVTDSIRDINEYYTEIISSESPVFHHVKLNNQTNFFAILCDIY